MLTIRTRETTDVQWSFYTRLWRRWGENCLQQRRSLHTQRRQRCRTEVNPLGFLERYETVTQNYSHLFSGVCLSIFIVATYTQVSFYARRDPLTHTPHRHSGGFHSHRSLLGLTHWPTQRWLPQSSFYARSDPLTHTKSGGFHGHCSMLGVTHWPTDMHFLWTIWLISKPGSQSWKLPTVQFIAHFTFITRSHQIYFQGM